VAGHLLAVTSALSTAYPGSAANADELLGLAHAYRQSAMALLENRRRSLARAPATLCAIHAVELYLNAFLLHRGSSGAEIRAHLHDLDTRGALARERGLTLRRRTNEHLAKMTRDREYLVSRYGAEDLATLSEINRLVATLNEIAKKVESVIQQGAGPPVPSEALCVRPLGSELIFEQRREG
jgi:hypothetical protein